MSYSLYIIKSLKDNNYYIGIAADPSKRLKQHNSGKVRSTKSRRPFILLYTEEHPSRLEAREKEKYLKSYNGVEEKRSIVAKSDVIGV